MDRIYKYNLHIGYQTIWAPASSRALAIGVQDTRIVMWSRVDPDEKKADREYHLAFTGEDVKDGYRYVGTTEYGHLVVHLLEAPALQEGTVLLVGDVQ